MIDRFDIQARGRGKGLHDNVKLILRDHVLNAGKAVRRSLFYELHCDLRSEIPISQDDVIHRRPALCVIAFQGCDGVACLDQGACEGPSVQAAAYGTRR